VERHTQYARAGSTSSDSFSARLLKRRKGGLFDDCTP
jgi:hypothetical protein